MKKAALRSLLLVLTTGACLPTVLPAQEQGSTDSVDGAVIEIDPEASPGIEVVLPAQEPEPEVQGAVADALEDVVPATGIESVDSAVAKLTEAVGGMVDGGISMLPNVVIALLVLLVAGLVANLADRTVTRIMKRARVRESLRDLGRIGARVGVWFAALMVAAGILFPGFGFAQLVATAGLASIALGFAFQDIFENFFAGILILWRFPFENGDVIECEGIRARIEDVEIRMTRLRLMNGELVLMPNSMIFKNVVKVLTNQTTRRIELVVGVAYGEDLAESRRTILEAVKGCDTVLTDRHEPMVLAQGFGASSIDFDVVWWCGSQPSEERKSRDQVIEAIKRALDEAGIEIPYPYRTLTFSKNEPDIIEAFARE